MRIEERNEKIQAILQKHGIAVTDQLVVDFLILLEKEYDEGCASVKHAQLTDKELLFVAYLLNQGSEAISRCICEDLDDDIHTIFSPQEKRDLMIRYGEYNGEPENLDGYLYPGYIHSTGSAMSDFMSYKIVKELSSKIDVKAHLPEELYPYFCSEESIEQIQEYKAQQEASRKERDRADKLKLFQELKEELEAES